MKKYIKIMFSCLFIFSITSCDLEDINIDPNNPKDVDLAYIFTSGERSVLYKFGRYTNGTDWDTWSGLWIQTFAGNHGAGINFDLYDIRTTSSSWGTQYDALNDLKEVIKRGNETQAYQHVGAAKVLIALQLGTLTSYYGDIPWSEALQGNKNSSPKFDTQEEIYNTIFDLLGQAVIDLDKKSLIDLGSEDFVYSGDAGKWKALAYALEARYHNHFSKRNPNDSANKALTAINNAKKTGFTKFSNDLIFPYIGEDIYLNGWFHMFENNQMVASEVFMETLTNTNDPRKIVYWNDKNTDGMFVGYKGKPNAFGTSNVSFSPIGPQGFYGKSNSPQLIVTHFELLFIEAEAALRLGQKERAATAMNKAIKSQFNLVTPASKAYLNSINGDVSAYESKITDYINNYASETSTSITLEKIMTEKYKAMVTMNGESWMDIRRHDYKYPNTLKIPKEPNGKPIADNFIQRVLYPQESYNTNSNTPENISIFSKLWIVN